MVAGIFVVILTEAFLDRINSPGQSLLGSAPRGRSLTFREYPVNGRFWTEPADARDVYPGGLEKRRYWIEIDSNGFLIPSKVYERAALELVFLGGSTTEGLFVTPEKRFPYRVGRILEETLGTTVNSYNGGRSGNVSKHSVLAFLGKVAPMQPKYVILMENINDLTVLHHFGSYWSAANVSRGLLQLPLEAWQSQTGLTRRVKNALHALFPNTYKMLGTAWTWATKGKTPLDEFAAIRGKEQPFDLESAESAFRRSLETFVAVSRIWQTTPILMTQANRFSTHPDQEILAKWDKEVRGLSYEQFRSRYVRFNDVIREVAAERNVPLIDLDSALVPDRFDMYDAIHYTDRGSERVAALIAEHILEIERAHTSSIP